MLVSLEEVLAKLIDQKDELRASDGLFKHNYTLLYRRLLGNSFFSGNREQVIEVFQSSLVSDEATIHNQLDVLTDAHGVGL